VKPAKVLLLGIILNANQASGAVANGSGNSIWYLSASEYSAASGVLQMGGTACEISEILFVSEPGECTTSAKTYGEAIIRKFESVQKIAKAQNFTSRDYEDGWSSRYPSDMSEPGITYAACAIAFNESYPGRPDEPNMLTPFNLSCNASMIKYGKSIIATFDEMRRQQLKVK
jgi:hypothetical protein